MCKSIKSFLMKVISANKHQTLPKDIPHALSASDFAFQMGFYITFGGTIIFLSFFFLSKVALKVYLFFLWAHP